MRLEGGKSATHVSDTQGDLPSLSSVALTQLSKQAEVTWGALQEYGVTLARWKNTIEMRRKYEPELGTLDYWVVVARPGPVVT